MSGSFIASLIPAILHHRMSSVCPLLVCVSVINWVNAQHRRHQRKWNSSWSFTSRSTRRVQTDLFSTSLSAILRQRLQKRYT